MGVTTMQEEGFKRCPDCAEQIQADARVCRFCGYRYASTSGEAASQPTRVIDLVEGWGTTLEPEEEVAFFLHAHLRIGRGSVGSGDGFLLLTQRRLLFFASPRRFAVRQTSWPAQLMVERRLDELGGSRRVGHLWWAALELKDELKLSGIRPRSKLEELRRHIAGSPV
jgi:hypothetical protein